MPELTKQQLIALADEKLRDARLLLDAGSSADAYYLAGYAVELLLKAIIASRFQADTLPDPDWSRRVFSHRIEELIGLALLSEPLKEAQDRNGEFAGLWQIVLQWNEASRYYSRDVQEAEELLEALEHPEHGVLRWLRTRL